ncbi:MAG: hypothetical protein ABIM02_04375 [candidate division WOR-3 bacterium]
MRVLLVNPPVYDFALHDFWLKPYGLLRIASSMKKAEYLLFSSIFLVESIGFIKALQASRMHMGGESIILKKLRSLRFCPLFRESLRDMGYL